jgi:anaerobic carbon-monoxide dehydrogenase iron sulfur subunit
MVKCDLCDGQPTCVRFCPTGALTYVEASTANLKKRRAATLKFSELSKKLGPG